MPDRVRQDLYIQANQLDSLLALTELVLHKGREGVAQFYEQQHRTKLGHPVEDKE